MDPGCGRTFTQLKTILALRQDSSTRRQTLPVRLDIFWQERPNWTTMFASGSDVCWVGEESGGRGSARTERTVSSAVLWSSQTRCALGRQNPSLAGGSWLAPLPKTKKLWKGTAVPVCVLCLNLSADTLTRAVVREGFSWLTHWLYWL